MAVTADCAARACACACTASCCAYAASCCACSACAFAAASAASASSRAVLSATSASRRAVSSSALYLMSDAIRVAIRVAIRCHSRHQPPSAHYLRESVSRSSRSAMRDAVPDEGGHQHTLRRTQTHSDALSRNQRAIIEQSDAIRRNQRQYPTLQLLARGPPLPPPRVPRSRARGAISTRARAAPATAPSPRSTRAPTAGAAPFIAPFIAPLIAPLIAAAAPSVGVRAARSSSGARAAS